MKYLEFLDTVFAAGITISKPNSEIVIHSPMGTNPQIINVSPLSVKCETLRHDSDAEYEAIKWAIDFDKWQHSWHNEISPENYNHFLEIIQGKVIEKSEQLVQLFSVAMFLANKIKAIESERPELLVKQDSKSNIDDLPF